MTTSGIQILQFGTGNFLRAFLGSMVQDLHNSGKNLNICVIQSTDGSTLTRLAAQDYKYHLLEAGFKNGRKVESIYQISGIKDGLKLPEQADKFLTFAESAEVKWLISNVTEAGMVMKNEGAFEEFAESFAGRLTQWLYRRFQVIPEAETIVLPCELLPQNADLLKKFVLQHCENWQLTSDFPEWIRQKVLFVNSLVDRIVPGFPSHLDLRLKESDPFLVQAEPYAFWALEGSDSLREKLPFLESKSEVILAADISGYGLRKVRLLNAPHTAMTGHGLLAGIATVGEWISDFDREQFLLEMITEEIIPTLPLDQDALKAYAESVLDRFKNPFVAHKLGDISLNSIAKIKSRLLPIVAEYREARGHFPPKLSLCLLSLLLFYIRNPARIRDESEVKVWFENIAKDQTELENLQLALKKWIGLTWNPEFEMAYFQIGK